jgi:hypothetical protein
MAAMDEIAMEGIPMQTIALSESAVALLRFRVKGWRFPIRDRDRGAFGELVAAGIMEPVGEDFRFTEDGWERREAILHEEEERIERERFEPPDTSNLSEAARALFRRHLAGDDEVTESNRAAYRELAAARILIPLSGFATGPEARYVLTYWGWHMRSEIAQTALDREGARGADPQLTSSIPSPSPGRSPAPLR